MPIDPELGPAITAFVARDYVRCSHLVGPVLEKNGPNLERAHLLVTCFMREGYKDDADTYGLQYAVQLKDPWEQQLLLLAVGRVNQEKLMGYLDKAESVQQRLQFLYHWGAYLVTMRMHREARKNFDTFMLSDMKPDPCLELYLLAVEYNYLNNGSSGTDIDKPVIELNKQVQELCSQNKHLQASEMAQRAYDLAKQTLGKQCPAYINSVNNMGVIQFLTGQYAEAKPLLEEHASLLRVAAGPEDPAYAEALISWGGACGKLGENEEAKKLFRQALEIQQKFFGENDPKVAETRRVLASYESPAPAVPAPTKKEPPKGFWGKLFGQKS